MNGKSVVLPIAAVIVVALGVTAMYKLTEPSLASMTFERLGDAPDAANATIHALPFKAVHAALFLEDHLEGASSTGWSNETIRLRVDSMRDTLADITGFEGTVWVVAWEGTLIRITS